MARMIFFITSIIGLLLVLVGQFYWSASWLFLLILIPYIAIGLYDVCNKKHNLLRIYPIIGHLRYAFENIRPEIQQYFIHGNLTGRPFNREQRSLVYQRAKGVNGNLPFGTERDITNPGYEFAYHSLRVAEPKLDVMRTEVGNSQCAKPYSASRLNISAMSFGAISSNAVLALNRGAKLGNFSHNTGEGGISPYHLQYGGDLVWQIGTGYFGCRNGDGTFNADKFADKAKLDSVRMVEIKLSQGAKPAHGGILPAEKITQEIAEIRHVGFGHDVISPPTHSSFSNPIECMQFVQQCRELSGGKPVGLKLCIGYPDEFMALVKGMVETKIYPDFITIDGAEGGTGAAPVEFSNRLGMPLDAALNFAHNCLIGAGLKQQIKIIASAKIITGFDMMVKFALGADLCNSARGFMFSLGCIQSLRCHLNTCPTGVTTQDPRRVQGLVVEDKYLRVRNFHDNTLHSARSLLGAMGFEQPEQLNPHIIYKNISHTKSVPLASLYDSVEDNAFLQGTAEAGYQRRWDRVRADTFKHPLMG